MGRPMGVDTSDNLMQASPSHIHLQDKQQQQQQKHTWSGTACLSAQAEHSFLTRGGGCQLWFSCLQVQQYSFGRPSKSSRLIGRPVEEETPDNFMHASPSQMSTCHA
jgi:hypothetical protein